MSNPVRNKIAGAIAGMVLGDALGVPGELWPREKVRERFGWIDTFLDGPQDNIVACYFKAAHYTDDSAQAFVVLKALLDYKAVPPVKELAKRLIDWVISMNGFEINLLGPSSKASLLAHSEGRDPSQYLKTALTNGAAMRIAPVGCLIDADKPELLAKTVAGISKVTHGTDVAIAGAAMVAQAVASGIAGRRWDEAAEDVFAIFDIAKTYGEPTWAASVKRRWISLGCCSQYSRSRRIFPLGLRRNRHGNDDKRVRVGGVSGCVVLQRCEKGSHYVRQHGGRYRHDGRDGRCDLRRDERY